MNYVLLSNLKIYDIKNKLLKKAAPKKDVRNPNGFTNAEKQKAIFLLMKKFNINESQATSLFYSKSGKYREELLELDNRGKEKAFSNLVEAGYFCHLFGSLKYSKIVNESTINKNLNILKAIPKIKTYHRSYTKRLIRIKILCIDDNQNKYNLNYVFEKYISKEGLYFVVKKHFEELANKIKGNVRVTYTAKTRLVILISKNIEDIMDK